MNHPTGDLRWETKKSDQEGGGGEGGGGQGIVHGGGRES